jgi:hypothetical protein
LNINTNTWTVFNIQNSNLPVNNVFDAAVSDSGDVWITLPDYGIAVLHHYLTGGIANISNDIRLNIYPNPSGKIVNIDYNGTLPGAYMIDMLTVEGKVVLKTTGFSVDGSIQKTLDLSGLSSGIYILKIYGKNSVATKKLVIK